MVSVTPFTMASTMADPPCGPPLASVNARSLQAAPGDRESRIRALVEDHYDFVWRTLRNLGLSDATAEDGAQQVMCVLARRADSVAPGAERRFLFSTAMKVAATLRRTAQRRRESSAEEIDSLVASTPPSDELLDERRAHALLQRVLDALPIDLRVVFVLYEIEELTTAEISAIVGIPAGTAASRLRRAREAFKDIARRMQAASRGRRRDP
jgi:RNA polymerase sigma-70 factor (ECF subfamily)